MRTRNHPFDRDTQRGAASLIVVVVLFFILALVTAYAGRNLIFEQRTSVNNMRATQAFEAAEAGLEFSITQLSGGRVDAACKPTTDTTNDTFRERHLAVDANNGDVTARPNLSPTCMLLNAGADCGCPAVGPPLLAVPVGLAPTYQVRFETVEQPGIVRAYSKGCSSIGAQCYAGVTDSADAVAEVSVLLGLNSALATPPLAALTARGNINFNGGAVDITNTDVPSRGITINAGGNVTNNGNVRLFSVPGTPGATSVLSSDPSLSSLDAARMFVSVFGMNPETYSTQPAAVRLTCAGDCGPAIAAKVSANPGRIIWIENAASIDSNLVLGSPGSPVLIAIQGNLTVAANLQVHGVVYLHAGPVDVTWTTVAGTTLIQGAVIAESGLSVVGVPNIVFDPVALRTINLTQGSMVRIPGSWRDFTPGS